VTPGRTGTAHLRVGEADTALAHHSGDLPVLATPRLAALFEEAACAAIAPDLEPGQTSVGTLIDVEHLAPTPVGGEVVAEARLAAVAGRRLEFTVSARDATGAEVGRGRHHRVLVDRDRFLARL